MNWHQMLAADNKLFLADMGVPIDIYGPAGEHYEMTGRVVRIDSVQDPQTGQMVYEPHLQITVHATDLPTLPKQDAGWIFVTTDVYGIECRRYIIDVRNDRTIGFVTMFGESYTDQTPIADPVTLDGSVVTFGGETVTYTYDQEVVHA